MHTFTLRKHLFEYFQNLAGYWRISENSFMGGYGVEKQGLDMNQC